MLDDLLSAPMTAHERALVLAGGEWMRAAACGYLRADALRMRDAGRNGLPAFMELAPNDRKSQTRARCCGAQSEVKQA